MLTECPQCKGKLVYRGVGSTLVAYYSPPGHDHDDNCKQQMYHCENGHEVAEAIQNVCPVAGCDWKGKTDCFCGNFKNGGVHVYDAKYS